MESSGAGWKMGMIDEQQSIFEFLKSLPPWLGGVFMALFVSVLRVIYDREETSILRGVNEGLICGALTLAIGSAVEQVGLGNGWHLFIGGMVGALGSQFVRNLAKRVINKKVDK